MPVRHSLTKGKDRSENRRSRQGDGYTVRELQELLNFESPQSVQEIFHPDVEQIVLVF